MGIFGFCEEHYEEGNEPLKSFGALVDLDLDTKFVLNDYLEVLAVRLYHYRIGFWASGVGVPDRANLVGEPKACCVEFDLALVERFAIAFECVRVVPWVGSVSEVREFAGIEAKELK